MRLGLRVLGAVAPDVAERTAAALFVRPRRRPTRPPEVAGREATPFSLGEGDAALQCWLWSNGGDGPTVLLVHGWEGHAGQLTKFVEPLLAAGNRVVAFDLPAHGHSSGHIAHLVIAAQALLRVGQVLGPLRGVVAHSFGGAATALALLEGLRAERVALLGAPAEPTIFVRRAAATLGLSPERTEGILRRLQHTVGASMESLDLRIQAGRIQTPALFLHDPEDAEVPWAHAEATARVWPGAQLLPMEGLGHWRVLKDPRAIGPVVAFLGGTVFPPGAIEGAGAEKAV